MDLSIIIVSYNNIKVITDCLKSIEKYNDIGDKLQVIIVEQSPDNSIYEFLKSSFTWVDIIRHDNHGFGAGNNAGEKMAKAPFLLFLNPDTVLVEPVFAYAVKKFCDDPLLGLFGVQLLDENHNKNSSFMMKVPYGMKNKIYYKICDKLGYYNSKSMFIQGADLFIRRTLFENIGGFDEHIFMYCEETDLTIRISKTKYKMEYDPSKNIIHLEGKSTDENTNSVIKKQMMSFRYICEKHGLPFYKIIRKEYRFQKFKKMIYTISRRDGVTFQEQLLEVIKSLM